MHSRFEAALACALTSLALSALRAEPAGETIRLPAAHLGDKPLAVRLYRPEVRNQTLPAVIMLHGCGGFGRGDEPNPRHRMWKDWLLERGHAVAFPLSFSSRGVSEICTQPMQGRSIRPLDRVADVLAVQRWLAAQPWVDVSRLILWGYSHGGSSVLATIAREPRAAGLFQQAIAFYPGCSAYAEAARRGERLQLAASLLLLIGAADDWTPAAPCERWVEVLRTAGQAAEIMVYPGAFHDFDSPGTRVRVRSEVPNGIRPGQGVTVGPDPQARADAQRRIAALLRELESRAQRSALTPSASRATLP